LGYYLDEKEVVEAFSGDEKDAKLIFESYDEIERLSNNKPKAKLPSGFSNVTDGSFAATLRELPKRYLAQLFTGNVTSTDRDEAWVAELANLVWSKKIIPNANQDDLFFNKQMDWSYRANKYGSQPMFAFYKTTEAYSGADCVLPYIRNVILEKGKVSDLAANRSYLVQFYDKYTLKSIIDSAEKEHSTAKKDKRETLSPWDVKQLKKLLDASPSTKDVTEQTETEREKGLDTGGTFKIIHCFQRGSEAPFYSFAPALGHEKNIVRHDENRNPTGDMPLILLYSDIERENPYGLGLGHLVGPNQNVQDFLTQAHMFATQYGLRPAIDVHGPRDTAKLDTIKWKSDHLIFTGNTDIKPFMPPSSIYAQFPTSIGLYKTQQQELVGSKNGSVGSQSGNPSYSKTNAGVKMQEASNGTNDGFLQMRHEQAYERLVTTMLNIHMANMEGEEILKIIDEEAIKLDRAGMELDHDQDGNITSQEALVEYDKMRGKFAFEVDANSSKEKSDNDDADAMEKEVVFIQTASQMPPQIPMGEYVFNTGEYMAAILRKKGMKDLDKILVKQTPQEQQGQQGIDPTTGQPIPPVDPNQPDPNNPGFDVNGQPLDKTPQGTTDPTGGVPTQAPNAMQPAQPQQPQPDVMALAQRAKQLDQTHQLGPQLAAEIAKMEAQGVDPQQIMQMITGGQQ
jgi:hypothetical protein